MPNTKPFAYFGTPDVSSKTLERLLEAGYVPTIVVTSPDAPKGRGLALAPSPTKLLAEAHGIRVLTPHTLDDAVLQELESCMYAVVVAYGKILPQKLIDAFPLGVLNIHYSLLPTYRGASPVEAALRNNDTKTGVTIQRMVYKLDAGDILAQDAVLIQASDTITELRPRLIDAGATLLIETLPAFEEGTIDAVPQDEAQATHVGKIRKEEGLLSIPGNDLSNWLTYRALRVSPGTYFFVERNGIPQRIKILEAVYENGLFTPTQIIPEGKRPMLYKDFIR